MKSTVVRNPLWLVGPSKSVLSNTLRVILVLLWYKDHPKICPVVKMVLPLGKGVTRLHMVSQRAQFNGLIKGLTVPASITKPNLSFILFLYFFSFILAFQCRNGVGFYVLLQIISHFYESPRWSRHPRFPPKRLLTNYQIPSGPIHILYSIPGACKPEQP